MMGPPIRSSIPTTARGVGLARSSIGLTPSDGMWLNRGMTTTAQDVCLRVLLDDGEVVRVCRIEQDDKGLKVRTSLGQVYPAERIITIHKS